MNMRTVEIILGIIHELRATNSKLAKTQILVDHRHNQMWVDYLQEVYNPFITYGRTGNKNGDQDDLENLKLCRSLNAGITAVTINKVHGPIIPTASRMMKAYDYGKKPKEIPGPYYVGTKYDGNYVNIISSNGLTFFTSGGHEYTHDTEMRLPSGFVFAAERIAGDGLLGDRRRCSLEGPKGAKFAKPDNIYKIFDCIPISDFNNGGSDHPYSVRRKMIPEQHAGDERLVHTWGEVEAYLDSLVGVGGEGVVIKHPDMLWRDSKSRRADFCKWKKIPTADLLCVDEFEGEGNAQGFLGSIRLRDSLGRHVNVGSGLARDIPFPSGGYVGRVIEISYEHINPEGTYVQPRVERIRTDKEINDID